MFFLITIVLCSNFYFSIQAITLKMNLPIRKILLVTTKGRLLRYSLFHLEKLQFLVITKRKYLCCCLFQTDRFNAHKNINERKLLWHGTNVAVVAAILKSGLRIMPHSGGRVGRGIYFASENSKSAGYGESSVNITSLNFRPLTDHDHLPEIVEMCKLRVSFSLCTGGVQWNHRSTCSNLTITSMWKSLFSTRLKYSLLLCSSTVSTAGRTGIMFLNEVALGKEHTITNDDWRLTKAPSGYDCIVARGRTEPSKSLSFFLEQGHKRNKNAFQLGCVPPAWCPYLPACTAPGGVPGPGGCTWSGIRLHCGVAAVPEPSKYFSSFSFLSVITREINRIDRTLVTQSTLSFPIFTARKRSCRKVIFSAMFVFRWGGAIHYVTGSPPPRIHVSTVGKRAVRILLQCFLFWNTFDTAKCCISENRQCKQLDLSRNRQTERDLWRIEVSV